VIDEAVAATLAAYPDLAQDVRDGAPKAWGALAAHGVIALKAQLGRAPSELERRALWSRLWEAVRRL